ncbi:hypothetical protein ABNG03_13625 [Halorubrum sp. RMP-47]|uniref:Uncharacterized protein n=1 Tax=Halorubrum miltondacostae TaxID=3076378 RepID=A0ABD5M324_9EURY
MTERDDDRSTDDRGVSEEREADSEAEAAEDEADGDADHLDDVEDGVGCTEIWERLSERREE